MKRGLKVCLYFAVGEPIPRDDLDEKRIERIPNTRFSKSRGSRNSMKRGLKVKVSYVCVYFSRKYLDEKRIESCFYFNFSQQFFNFISMKRGLKVEGRGLKSFNRWWNNSMKRGLKATSSDHPLQSHGLPR